MMPAQDERRTEPGASMEIAFAEIAKEFGETAALRGVSLDIHAGELLALLGPRARARRRSCASSPGSRSPSADGIVGGEGATGSPVQRAAGRLRLPAFALFRHLTVADNIAYGLRARAASRRPARDEIARRITELLELIQLSGYERRFPAQLSGGQRQRVALARALAVEPRVLLLDEPFGALDAKVRKELRRWLRDIHEATGQTTMFVTHDQDEALELADRGRRAQPRPCGAGRHSGRAPGQPPPRASS